MEILNLVITILFFIFKDGGRSWTSLPNYLMQEIGSRNVAFGF